MKIKLVIFLIVLLMILAVVHYSGSVRLAGISGKLYSPSGNIIDNSVLLHKASYYEKSSGNKVRCVLCPKKCSLAKGRAGYCLIRKNLEGELYNITYGKVRLYHYKAGEILEMPLTGRSASRIDVQGRSGCALKCTFCFIGEVIQRDPSAVSGEYYTPAEVIKILKAKNIKILVFTDNEPVINYEYTLDLAKLARKSGIQVVLTTGGYADPEPFIKLAEYMDVVFFSLKGFSERAYNKFTSGSLAEVLKNLKALKEKGIKLEVLYLLIPTISDGKEDIANMSKWIKNNLGAYTPVHFMRYKPAFKLKNLPPASYTQIRGAMLYAKKAGLKYVIPYANFGEYDLRTLIKEGVSDLSCPYCGKPVIEYVLDRSGTPLERTHFNKNKDCGWCGKKVLNLK